MFPRRHDINVNIQMPTTNIDQVVEHRDDDEVVLMERSGEMDIREDEQGRKTGVETFACGTCGQQVTVGPGIVLRRLSELSKRAVIRHVQGWSTS